MENFRFYLPPLPSHENYFDWLSSLIKFRLAAMCGFAVLLPQACCLVCCCITSSWPVALCGCALVRREVPVSFPHHDTASPGRCGKRPLVVDPLSLTPRAWLASQRLGSDFGLVAFAPAQSDLGGSIGVPYRVPYRGPL